ncbi:unnamed protein product, partial [Didymodactylos carnosus]
MNDPIDSIVRDESEKLWKVKLTLADNTDNDIEQYSKHFDKETIDKN